jgi:hypothetical protein
MLHILPCFKGFQYVYSLSRQGQSYVRWLRDRKPLEDIAYFTLLNDVMMALPEDLRRMPHAHKGDSSGRSKNAC